jgi:hypothetical protein
MPIHEFFGGYALQKSDLYCKNNVFHLQIIRFKFYFFDNHP